jgi:hypothetical protein
MAPILPLEIWALIASFVEPKTLSALALVSRKLLGVVDRRRHVSPSVDSAKSFVALCETFKCRPGAASQARRLIFDWDPHADTQEFHPLFSLVQLVSAALAHATRLNTLTFLRLPPQSFVEFLANFTPHLTGVHSLEYGALSESFDYARLNRENHLSTIFVSLINLSTVCFHSILPRPCLHSMMKVIGNRTSPLIDTVTLAVQEVDFGVIQEITLQDPTTKHESPCLADLTILGRFSRDPYAPVRIMNPLCSVVSLRYFGSIFALRVHTLILPLHLDLDTPQRRSRCTSTPPATLPSVLYCSSFSNHFSMELEPWGIFAGAMLP